MEGTTTMGTFLTSTIQPVVTAMFTYVTQVGSSIIADPILSVSLGIFITGAAVGIFGRLLSRN